LAHDHLLSVIPNAAEESARSDSIEDARPREGPFEPRNARAVHSPRWQAARLFKQTACSSNGKVPAENLIWKYFQILSVFVI